MQKLSVAIITFNEERNIMRCLQSVEGIADEIVVIDSLSTDKTEEICKKFNVRFIKNPFPGHIEQKNIAKDNCTHDLVLSLDADEALSPELRTSITEVKNNPSADGYSFNRATFFCGKHIKHCGWYPDVSLRLWNRNKGTWGGYNPHDRFILQENCTVKHIEGDLLHYSYYTINEHVVQCSKFSTISANSKFKNGKRSSLFKIIVYPFWKFVKDYFLRRGFLDGYYGFVISMNSAHEVFQKYAKLKELEESQPNR